MVKAQHIAVNYCQSAVLTGINLVLQARLSELLKLREAALNWDDIEGVHDMRVASRRLRSALRDFQPYLRKKIPPKRLRKIAATLGAVRDEDVAIVALEKLSKDVPNNLKPGIEKLTERRRATRARARRDLIGIIQEDVLRVWGEKFSARIELATQEIKDVKKSNSENSFASQRFDEAGREIMSANFCELRQTAISLHRPLDIEPLHRMRIAAKRFRYSMELFSPCRDDSFSFFTDEVAELQSSLGKLHDCDVWIAALGEKLDDKSTQPRRTVESRPLDQEEQRASLHLLGHFTEARARQYRKTLERWTEWEATDFAAKLDAALRLNRAS